MSKMAASAAAASEGPRRTLCVRGGSERDEDKTGGAFSTSWCFLTTHPYRALKEAASWANEGWGSVAIGTAAAIVRANLPEPPTRDMLAVDSRFTRIVRC